MNQSIGCAPMPFALVSDKAPAESATLPPGLNVPGDESETSFSEALDSEIEDDAKSDKKPNELEAWTLYGTLPITAQVPPVAILLAISTTEEIEGLSQLSDASTVQDQTELLPANISPKAEPGLIEEAKIQRSEDALKMQLETLKPAEQKVPSPLETDLKGREEIAENPAKPAKTAYGMLAAQGELMVSESPKQEETALEQNLSLSAEFIADTDAEPLSPIKSLSAAKNSSSDTKFNYADFAPVEGPKSEWSSFEGISESSDLQPVKASEAVEIAQAIRTHVQVLKGSSQEKLDVVLRPDGQTELRLHVEKVNGQILVQARCDRGDFARLESNWTAVQQSLANLGVRVESLEHGNFYQNLNDFQNPSRTFDERSAAEQQRDNNFIEQKSRAPKDPQPATSRGPAQGWQSWA
jgi:hypothetical protein